MADYDPIVVVPEEDPEQTAIINKDDVQNPFTTAWWTEQTASGVPENVMGWLVSQGWRITGVTADNSTNPPTNTYALTKLQMSPLNALLSLCNSYTKNANDAKFANEVRYEEIVNDWTEMISSSQTQFEQQITQQNSDLGVYITDLDSYMSDIETDIASNNTDLATEYITHANTAKGFLDDLGTAEVDRINEQFAATLSVQLQDLIDRGLYTSVAVTDVTARNTRDRNDQLQLHYDRLAREKLGNEHTLWAQRIQLVEQVNQAIVQKMNTATMRLQGWKDVAAENQKLMAYQLDTRNNLLIGLYSFVERREDVAPEWKDMSQMIAGLADSGGGWITP